MVVAAKFWNDPGLAPRLNLARSTHGERLELLSEIKSRRSWPMIDRGA
jgi:hypothetical protein